MPDWVCAASRDLPVSDSSSWDAAAARASVFSWAGFDGDNPDPDKAKRAFLVYDRAAADLKGSYKLPFAHVVSGKLTAVTGGLRAAASRLPQTDAPAGVLERARGVLDAYFKRLQATDTADTAALEHKFAPLLLTELRAAEAAGDKRQIEGYASTFGGDPDAYGDVVVKGAFVESLRKRTPKLLWQHDQEQPIGKALRLEEDGKGLYGLWQLVGTSTALNAYELVKEQLVEGLSIGFFPKEWDYRADDGVRLLHAVDLLEISAVTIPANESAVITGVKADVPFDTFVTRITHGLTLATREAEALLMRRGGGARALTDRQRAAAGSLLDKAEAELKGLRELIAVSDMEMETPKEIAYRLHAARRRLAAQGLLEGAPPT